MLVKITDDSSWLQRRECLPSALSRMTQLRRISLRYLANDTMVFDSYHSVDSKQFQFYTSIRK